MSEHGISAFVVQDIPGRLRVKIPAKRGDEAYFARIAARFCKVPSVLQASGNPRTASLLILYSPRLRPEELRSRARRLGLMFPEPRSNSARHSLFEYASAGVGVCNRRLATASYGFVDLPSAILIGLLLLALRQAARGQILVPAFALLWYAAGLLAPDKMREPARAA